MTLPTCPAVISACPIGQTLDELRAFEFGWNMGSWEWYPADFDGSWATVAVMTGAGRLGPRSSADTTEGRIRTYCPRRDAPDLLKTLRNAGTAEAMIFLAWTEAGAPTRGAPRLRSGVGSALYVPVEKEALMGA